MNESRTFSSSSIHISKRSTSIVIIEITCDELLHNGIVSSFKFQVSRFKVKHLFYCSTLLLFHFNRNGIGNLNRMAWTELLILFFIHWNLLYTVFCEVCNKTATKLIEWWWMQKILKDIRIACVQYSVSRTNMISGIQSIKALYLFRQYPYTIHIQMASPYRHTYM